MARFYRNYFFDHEISFNKGLPFLGVFSFYGEENPDGVCVLEKEGECTFYRNCILMAFMDSNGVVYTANKSYDKVMLLSILNQYTVFNMTTGELTYDRAKDFFNKKYLVSELREEGLHGMHGLGDAYAAALADSYEMSMIESSVQKG